MVRVATPAPSSVPVPRLVAPSEKVTVPAGVPAPGATTVTVAVSVTGWPKADGLAGGGAGPRCVAAAVDHLADARREVERSVARRRA